MKRMLCFVLCLMMVLSVFAGCGKEPATTTAPAEHKHAYSKEWTADAESHWYMASCGCDLKANLANHEDADKDGICDVCAYAEDCDHQFDTATWVSDAENHWHPAGCAHTGAKSEVAAHADADNNGACDVCAYVGDHVHTYENTWSSNATEHWYAATCGHQVKDQLSAHIDANNDGNCDVCGWFDETHTHTYEDGWTWDAVFHWHGATCEHSGAVSEKAEHADADGDELCDSCGYRLCDHRDFDDDGTCELCGWSDPNHTHTYAGEMSSDGRGHWQSASCHSGATSPIESHADKDQNGICDVCNFQICSHVFDEAWSSNETHHWKAVMCKCSIGRKDYAEHTLDATGACVVCMYGYQVKSVYEVVIDKEPVTLEFQDKMYIFQEFTVSFPQAGKYVLYPSDERVKISPINGYGQLPTDPAITIEVEEACEKTYYFYLFDFAFEPFMEVPITYSLVRMDDVIVETMQGKVELPTNTIYRLVFKAPELGTYNLITSISNVVIGLTEASMEYYKGHIDFEVTEIGQEVEIYVELRDLERESFIFDWVLEPPFSLDLEAEGNYAVSVDPKSIDYKINFVAPADGNYKLSVDNAWLTFCAWNETYNQPTRLETTEVLTGELKAGEVYSIWLQAVYNYPESTHIASTLSISNVGTVIEVGQNQLDPMTEGSRFTFIATETSYFKITAEGGEIGVIAPNGKVTWTNGYEVKVKYGYSYTFMVRGEGVAAEDGNKINVTIETVTYEVTLNEGSNVVTLTQAKEYDVLFGTYFQRDVNGEYLMQTEKVLDAEGNPVLDENGDVTYKPVLDANGNPIYLTTAFNDNQIITLTWNNPRVQVYVNGEAYVAGTEVELMHNTITVMAMNNQPTEVEFQLTVTNAKIPDKEVEGEAEAVLYQGQIAKLAIKEPNGKATGTFTAEVGGKYTFQCMTAGVNVYILNEDGSESLLFSNEGAYTFQVNAGESVIFVVRAASASEVMSVDVIVDRA